MADKLSSDQHIQGATQAQGTSLFLYLLQVIPKEIRILVTADMNKLRGFDGDEMKYDDVLQLTQTHKAEVDRFLLNR